MQAVEKAAIGLCVLVAVGGLGFMASQRSGRTIEPYTPTGSNAARDLGQIATISHGEQVKVEDYLEPGTRTVIEFTADW